MSRIARMMSSVVMPGMVMSSKTRSTVPWRSRSVARAEAPFAAVRTAQPLRVSRVWVTAQTTGSSSTTRMVPLQTLTTRGSGTAGADGSSRQRGRKMSNTVPAPEGTPWIEQTSSRGGRVCGYPSTRLLGGAVHDGQSQPGAMPLGLGREEGLEQVLSDLVRDAWAGVGDAQLDEVSRPCKEVRTNVVLAHLHIPETDGERSLAMHRVARVDCQVEDHLGDLGAVCQDGPGWLLDIADDVHGGRQ